MNHEMTFTFEELRLIRNTLATEIFRLEREYVMNERIDTLEELVDKITNEMRKDENFGRK